MRISDWSSDVCSSDLIAGVAVQHQLAAGAWQHCAQPGAIGERLASGYGAVGERMVNQDDTEMPTQRLQTCFERCELRGTDPATGEQWRGRHCRVDADQRDLTAEADIRPAVGLVVAAHPALPVRPGLRDRKSTRLNSSH